MIEARELRIGNLVDWNGEIGKISQILELDVVFKCGETDLIEKIKPIPLTKEWLLKLGATEAYGKIYLSLTNLKAEIHFDIYRDGIVSTIHSSFCELILDEIKHAHQLQNLYFALTGEELILK